MKKIPLLPFKDNHFALVDDEDFEQLKEFRWYHLNHRYAYYRKYLGYEGKKQKVKFMLMHRIIAKTPDALEVDHANGDGFDNQKSNLRNCTRRQNMHNGKMQSNNKSGHTGVTWSKSKGKWRAEIKFNGTPHHLGYFDLVEDAAKARDVKAKELHKDFAVMSTGR